MNMHVLSWSALKSISVNRAVHTASVWAVLVPITAKVMEKVQDVVTIELLGHSWPLHLALPFSWKVLFVTAIAFMLANLLVAARCPSLISETGSFRDYEAQQRGDLELERVFAEMPEPVIDRYMKVAWIGSTLNGRVATPGGGPGEAFYQRFRQGFQRNEVYGVAREFLDRQHLKSRLAATGLYLVGGLGFGVLLAQNIWFVAQHW